MIDEIEQLRAKRDALAVEIKAVDDALTEVEHLTKRASEIARGALGIADHAHSGHPEPVHVDAAVSQPARGEGASERTRAKRGPKGSSPDEIADAAALIIEKEGRPMTRFELIEPIEARGLTIGGYDKPRNIGTILWRSKKFRSTGDGYWPDPEGNDPPVPDGYDEPDFDPVAAGQRMLYGR